MLRLIQKKLLPQSKSSLFFVQLCFASIVVHFILVVALLLYKQELNVMHHLMINHHDMKLKKVCLLPLVKTVPGGLKTCTEQQKKSVHKKTQPLAHKKQEKKEKETPTVEHKNTQQTITNSIEQKKEHIMSRDMITQKEEKIVTKKQNDMHDITLNEKKEVPKKEESSQEKVDPSMLPLRRDFDHAEALAKADDTIYIGRDDARILKESLYVQQEIAQQWRPPLGIARDVSCQMQVVLTDQGTIDRIDTVASSKIITYDIAARNVLRNIHYPKLFWGKILMITFKE